MPYKHVIWDWNGTMLDDLRLSVSVFNKILGDFAGSPAISAETYRENFGFPVADFYARFGFDISGEKLEEAGRGFIKEYNARRFECRLQRGVLDSLELFKRRGLTQSVLSACEKTLLLQALAHYKIDGYFTRVDGPENIYAKSKIELGKAHVKALGADPSLTAMIGDTVHDKQAADAMGVDCVLLCAGHNSRRRLLQCGAPVFDTHAQIAEYILNKSNPR